MRLNIVTQVLLSIFRPVAKFLVSFFKLVNTKAAINGKIEFPLTVRGSGDFEMGDRVILHKRVVIFNQGTFKLGGNSEIHQNVKLRIGKSAKLKLGNRTIIEECTTISIKSKCWKLKDNVYVASGCSIFSRENQVEGVLNVGENTNISNNCTLDLTGDIFIGKNVAIAHNTSIFTHDHVYSSHPSATWKGEMSVSSVKIGDGSWIGANVTILAGVEIGSHAVIAAGSIVTKNIPSNTVSAGVPSKVIKKIND